MSISPLYDLNAPHKQPPDPPIDADRDGTLTRQEIIQAIDSANPVLVGKIEALLHLRNIPEQCALYRQLNDRKANAAAQEPIIAGTLLSAKKILPGVGEELEQKTQRTLQVTQALIHSTSLEDFLKEMRKIKISTDGVTQAQWNEWRSWPIHQEIAAIKHIEPVTMDDLCNALPAPSFPATVPAGQSSRRIP